MQPRIKINACPHLCVMVGNATAATVGDGGGVISSVLELSYAVINLIWVIGNGIGFTMPLMTVACICVKRTSCRKY